MKKAYFISLVFIVLLVPLLSRAQKSYIYNEMGQLRVDTTLSISQNQYRIWCSIEGNILSHVSNSIDYNRMAKESGLTGIIIVAFDSDTLDLKNIRLLNQFGGGLDENVITGINKISKKIVNEFRMIQGIRRKGTPLEYLGTYYIPISFKIIKPSDYMKETNTMPIIGISSGTISRWHN